jgi:hypothetical protein
MAVVGERSGKLPGGLGNARPEGRMRASAIVEIAQLEESSPE